MRSSTKDKLGYMFWFLFAACYAVGVAFVPFGNAVWALCLAVALAAVIPFVLAFGFVSLLDNAASNIKAERRKDAERAKRDAHYRDVQRNVHVGDQTAQAAVVESIIREEQRAENITNIRAMIDYYKNSIEGYKGHIQELENALRTCGAVSHSEGCEAPKHVEKD